MKDLSNEMNSIRRLKLRCCFVLGRMSSNGRLSLGEDVGIHYLKLQSAVMACTAKSKKMI
jgi:hypothetical protein